VRLIVCDWNSSIAWEKTLWKGTSFYDTSAFCRMADWERLN
jgi:hypothetical protein